MSFLINGFYKTSFLFATFVSAIFLSKHMWKQGGAVEACWAHNPEVDGSKPSLARLVQIIFVSKLKENINWSPTLI